MRLEISARIKAFLQHAVLLQQGAVHAEQEVAFRVLLALGETLFELARVPQVEQLHRILASGIVSEHEIGE